jgi:stage III sporulation protein AF
VNILRDWIVGITGAAAVAAVSLAVSPEGRVKRVVSLVCGLVVIIALIAPISDFDYLRFRDSLFSLHEDALAESAPALEVSEKLTRTIIEEKYAAYIWDKGAALGMTDLEVGVTVCMSADGAWLPQSATIATTADKTLRDKLAYAIETGLGLPPEELIWRVNDEN